MIIYRIAEIGTDGINAKKLRDREKMNIEERATITSNKPDVKNCSDPKQFSPKNIAQIVYLCQALSFLFGITAIVGVILNYLKRDEAKGTWLESHFVWQIKTFWIGLIASFVGFILIFVLIGFFILAATLVWIIYRAIKGYLLLDAEKPIENPSALI